MNRNQLESYQANKRLIERNKKKLEEEKYKDIPVVMGKVKGSSHEYPYTERRFTVQMEEPAAADRAYRRRVRWELEIKQAEKEIDEVERFISAIADVRDREIFIYRYIDGIKIGKIASNIGYSHGRVSQIISKYLKD